MSDLLEQRIEAAARAIDPKAWEARDAYVERHGWHEAISSILTSSLRDARRALLASDAVLAQAGMVVVPREPSRSMIDAAYKVLSCDDKGTTATRIGYLMWGWSTMIDAFVNPGDGG